MPRHRRRRWRSDTGPAPVDPVARAEAAEAARIEPAPPAPPGSRPELWRANEEGAAAEAAPPQERPSAPLWRPDEGRTRRAPSTAPAATAPPPQPPPGGLWKEYEGTVAPSPGLRPAERAPRARDILPEGNGAGGSSERRRPPATRKAEPRRRRGRLVAYAVLGALIVAFVFDATFASVKVAGALTDAKASLDRGKRAFEAGDLAGAKSEFELAAASSREARGYSRHPALALLSHFPVVGPDAGALQTLSAVGELAARAGSTAVRSGEFVGIQPEGFAETIYDHGQVQLSTLSGAAPFVDEVAGLIEQAGDELDAAPEPFLGIVQDALRDSKSLVTDANETAGRARALVGTLPALLGGEGTKRYLLAFQAPGEARATGGLVGLYGVLEASEGRLDLVHVGPVKEIFPDNIRPPVSAPAWFEDNYGPQSALKQIQQVNVSPNFPVVADVMLRMYEAVTGKTLDGVLAMDPVALGDLMPGTGPITVDGVTVDETNAAKTVMHDSYERYPRPDDQNVFLGDLIDAFWTKVQDGDVKGPALVKGLGRAVATQHMKIYSDDPDEQAAIEDLGADGSFESAGPNVQMIFNNNYGLNKIDYYLHRTIDTEVKLTPQGDGVVTTTVQLDNTAPPGPASLILGKGKIGLEPGENRTTISFLLPRDARSGDVTVKGERKHPFSYRDDGYPVPWELLTIPPQQTLETSIEYDTPRAGPDGEFEMTLWPQATAQPDLYSFTVLAPPGYLVEDLVTEGDPRAELTFEGTLDEPRSFDVRLVPEG